MKRDTAREFIRHLGDPDKYHAVLSVGLRHIPAENHPQWGHYPETFGVFVMTDDWDDVVIDAQDMRDLLPELH